MGKPDLFGYIKKRKPPRVMMHVVDAGNHWAANKGIQFRCDTCGYDTGWIIDEQTFSENKRGLPCPDCNAANGGSAGICKQ